MRLLVGVLLFLVVLSGPLPLVAGSAEDTFLLRPHQRRLALTGFTRPVAEMEVSSEVGGRYLAITVQLGDVVSGPVARLDSTFVELDLEANKIAQRQAARQLELEKKTAARFASLIGSRSTDQASYEEAVLRADILELTLASLANDEARLRQHLLRHRLTGPVGWEVMARYAEEGEYLPVGAPLLRLGDFRRLLLPLLLSYEELEILRRLPEVPLFFPEIGVEVAARLHRFAPGAAAESRKFLLELLIDSSDAARLGKVRGGLRAQLELVGKEEAGVFVAPSEALDSYHQAHWLTTADGERQQVVLLATTADGEVVVSGEGLRAGGQYRLRARPATVGQGR